jgi:hypothetical protein
MPDAAQQESLILLGRWLRSCDYRFITVTPATHERVNARARRENWMEHQICTVGYMRRSGRISLGNAVEGGSSGRFGYM